MFFVLSNTNSDLKPADKKNSPTSNLSGIQMSHNPGIYSSSIDFKLTLDGSVTAIGGLDHKIMGSIKAGVTAFIFPEENKRDFEKFMEKYAETALLKDKNIQFYPVSKIQEVFDLILEQ